MKKPNGLIRQYVPMGKGTDELNDEDVAEIIDRIKIRSRECLGSKIPKQLFSQLHQPASPASLASKSKQRYTNFLLTKYYFDILTLTFTVRMLFFCLSD